QAVLADVDGDGRLDLVVRTSNGIEQRRNLGSRAFSLEVLMQGQKATNDCAAGDTMGRGMADLLVVFADGTHMLLVGSPGGLVLDHLPWVPVLPSGLTAVGDID